MVFWLVLAVLLAPHGHRGGAASPSSPALKLPLSFVPNRGQTDSRVRYYAQTPGFAAYFTRRGVTIAISKGRHGQAIELRFPGADRTPSIAAADRDAGRVSYLTGAERHTGIPTYGRVVYRDLWPGIDLVFAAESGQLTYELHLAPGANPANARFAYAGIDGLSVAPHGGLAVHTRSGTLRDAAPRSRQGSTAVASRFRLTGRHSYGFSLGAYDRSRPLVIDPALAYSTFLGGSSDDHQWGIAVDSHGNSYVAGQTHSPNFPATPGAIDTTFNGGTEDAFVAKLNPAGTALVYATYMGGDDWDSGQDVTVDGNGNAYVMGFTTSTSFPVTSGAFQTDRNGFDENFVAKLGPAGALQYSTLLGGSGAGFSSSQEGAIAVDAAGQAIATGFTTSSDFPTTPGAYKTASDGLEAFVTKFNEDGTGLVYSTFLGPGLPQDIAVDVGGNAFVAGLVGGDYPTTAGAYDRTANGQDDVFVTKLAPSGSALVYSTFIGGGASDHPYGLAIDSAGSAYVTGRTALDAAVPYPTTPGAYDRSRSGFADAFVSKLDPSGSALAYSTYLGGSGDEGGFGVAVDAAGSAHVIGTTFSTDFPTTADALDATHGYPSDAFYVKLDLGATALEYSTYFGGAGYDGGTYAGDGGSIALDPQGNAYLTGSTQGGVPTTPGAFDTSHNGDEDTFIAKFSYGPGPPATLTLAPKTATNTLGDSGHCVTATVEDAAGDPTPDITVRFTVTGATSASGSETTDDGGQATFCYQGPELPGTDQITATVDPSGPSDTATKTWVAPQSTEGCKVTGGGGITAQNDDRATFDNNVRTPTASDVRGRIAYTDRGPAESLTVRSKAIDALICDGRRATIYGSTGSTPFRVDLNDRGQPGRRDTYRILLGSGYDSGTQTLDVGNIRVRG